MELKQYYDIHDNLVKEEYYSNDELVRTTHYYSMNILSECVKVNGKNYFGIHADIYIKNGKTHCDDNDKPAFVIYFPNGSIQCELYYKNGKVHRDDDKPARIEYYGNGTLKREFYYIEDRVERINLKPTIVDYPEDKDKEKNYIINSYTDKKGTPIECVREEYIIPLTKSSNK